MRRSAASILTEVLLLKKNVRKNTDFLWLMLFRSLRQAAHLQLPLITDLKTRAPLKMSNDNNILDQFKENQEKAQKLMHHKE